jgi:hypothetical protein
MILSLTSWQYDPPIWVGCTSLMECDSIHGISHVCVELPENCSWDDNPGDEVSLGRSIRLTLH